MTVKQIQHLLGYLDYYKSGVDGSYGPQTREAVSKFQEAFGGLDVDGKAGPQTQKALKHAVAFGMPERSEEAEVPGTDAGSTGTFWDGIRHFTREEFKCKCGGKYCNGFPAEPQEKLIRAAELVREHFGQPVTVSSGVRCSQHNRNVGGVYNSRHLRGSAMDFCVRGVSAELVLGYVRNLPGIVYAYAIDGSYVHMDVG